MESNLKFSENCASLGLSVHVLNVPQQSHNTLCAAECYALRIRHSIVAYLWLKQKFSNSYQLPFAQVCMGVRIGVEWSEVHELLLLKSFVSFISWCRFVLESSLAVTTTFYFRCFSTYISISFCSFSVISCCCEIVTFHRAIRAAVHVAILPWLTPLAAESLPFDD